MESDLCHPRASGDDKLRGDADRRITPNAQYGVSARYCAQPPEKGIDWPTKKSLSFEARNNAKSASSRAVASLPIGTVVNICLNSAVFWNSTGK
jgi:hypothetical protein